MKDNYKLVTVSYSNKVHLKHIDEPYSALCGIGGFYWSEIISYKENCKDCERLLKEIKDG